MKTRKYFYYGKFAVLGVAGVILFSFAVMWLWNALVPELFNGPIVTYWQTLGLLVLSKILFSGMGKGSGHGHHKHHHKDCRKDHWKEKYEKKMNGMRGEHKDEGEATVVE